MTARKPFDPAAMITGMQQATSEIAAFRALYHAESFTLTRSEGLFHLEFTGPGGMKIAQHGVQLLPTFEALATKVAEHFSPEAMAHEAISELERMQDEHKRSHETKREP